MTIVVVKGKSIFTPESLDNKKKTFRLYPCFQEVVDGLKSIHEEEGVPILVRANSDFSRYSFSPNNNKIAELVSRIERKDGLSMYGIRLIEITKSTNQEE